MPGRGHWRLDPQADLDSSDLDAPAADSEQQAERAHRRALDKGLRALATREHSRVELVRKLAGKGVSRESAERVVDELDAQGLQSDARFAESFVHGRIERGYGPVWIRQALAQRGVASDLVESLLDRPRDFWAARALELRERKFGSGAPADRSSWEKQARFLAQRGFPTDLVMRVLDTRD